MDSATAAVLVAGEGYEVHALAIDYGQRHAVELDAARRVADALALASFRVVRVDLAALGGSALTDDVEVPKDRNEADIGGDIPITYVPARNTIFLAIALAAAEVLDADAVVLGVNALDYSGYPDCRPAFLDAFREVSAQGTKRGVEGRPVEILAPLLAMTKAEIVLAGQDHGVPFELTLSCYDPAEGGVACGRCDACRLRARGFEAAGIDDPART
jgi:7-cyano-7-deazaguanine synthase